MKSAPFRKTSVVLCALAALLLLPGCGGRSASIQQQGAVTLVETLTIGHDDSDDAFLFSSIPAVAVLDDGRIVLSDSQDPRLRLFNEDGSFRRYIGAQGGGPGEMERPISVSIVNGQIVAAEQMRQRFIVFDSDGDFKFEQPFPATMHPYTVRGVGENLIAAVGGSESLADGTSLDPIESRYVRVFNDSLVSVRRFGKLSAIMDPSSPLERQAASFASVVLDANAKTLVVAPRSYRCRLARYDWNEDTPVVSMLESQSCPDRGYRELTEAEFNDYRKLAEADDLGSIPGSLGASFTSEGKSYSLVWRVAEGVVMRDDGSVLVLVNAYANGWARRVDYFSAAGAFVGSFPIKGLPDDLKGGFVGSDNSGNWYYRSTSAEGLPGIKRFSVELELPEGS